MIMIPYDVMMNQSISEITNQDEDHELKDDRDHESRDGGDHAKAKIEKPKEFRRS
jgi:hypothetical protein